jgi:HlyD family secretion protein
MIAGSIGGWIWTKDDPQPSVTANFATAQVHKGTLQVEVSGSGTIQPAARESIAAAEPGVIAQVSFQQGDRVKKGDILVAFEQEDAASEIRSKRLELETKRLSLEELKISFKQAPDKKALDQLQVSIKKQQLEIQKLEADIAELESAEKIDPLVAPIDGTLTLLSASVGQTANTNNTLAEVADYNHLQVVLKVDELDIAKVKLGQAAEIAVEALPEKKFIGTVAAIANEGTANNGVATFEVTVDIANPEGLMSGMSANATIMTEKKEDALYLPIEAVQSLQDQYFVLIPSSTETQLQGTQQPKQQVKMSQQSQQPQQPQQSQQSGRNQQQQRREQNNDFAGASKVTVEVGIHNEDYIEILSGLKEGDAVVVPNVQSSSSNRQMMSGFGTVPPGAFGGGGNVRVFSGERSDRP